MLYVYMPEGSVGSEHLKPSLFRFVSFSRVSTYNYLDRWILTVGCGSTGQIWMRQKFVVLRELQRTIIYTAR